MVERLESVAEPEVGEKCGNCKFGKRVDISAVECNGIPPTPVGMMAADAMGRPTMAVQLLRPRLPSNTPACALWKFKSQLIDLSRQPPEGTS
jgi:hypothetical protein